MRNPRLSGLPAPPSGRTGLPLTDASLPPLDTMPDGRAWPRISIVTPSYNQAQFIEETIRSVLLQGYPNLEYIIIDGGSTDNSVEIITNYEPGQTYWVSERDGGQYDAINKGFAHSSGDIMSWINSDDKYLPDAFSIVAEIFSTFPEIEWLTSTSYVSWDSRGRSVSCWAGEGFNRKTFFRGRNSSIPGLHRHSIQQEGTFWRRSLWEKAGGYLRADLRMAGDFELWARFWQHAELYSTSAPLGGFRSHSGQKTRIDFDLYIKETISVLNAYNVRLPKRLEIMVGKRLASVPLMRRLMRYPTQRIEYDQQRSKWITRTAYFS